MNNTEFIQMMDKNPELKQDLFIRGFLVSSEEIENTDGFPFYGNWRCEEHGGYYFYAHKLTGMHIYTDEKGNSFFLLGHAYDPFTMEIDEDKILQHIGQAYGSADYMERINNITGVFVYGDIANGKISYLVDPSGMQSACSGILRGGGYSALHPTLN